jgi:hypothetical protein
MMTRIHGRINFECDGCGEVLDTETSDFASALICARSEMWESSKIKDVWNHYCSRCADEPTKVGT